MYHKKQKHHAFTLVELIVVIVILAILATIAFLSFSSQSGSARDSARLSDINMLKKSMEMFSLNSSSYPLPDNGVNVTYSGGTIWTQGTLGDAVKRQISTISKKPIDPLSGKEYTYSLLSNKREFQIAANFENPVSLNKINEGDKWIPAFARMTEGLGITTEQVGAEAVTGTICYINGNFNGLLAKVSTGSSSYVLAVPSLIVVDPSVPANLVYDPSFGSGKLQCNGKNSPCTVSFDSSSPVFNGIPSNDTEVLQLITNLQKSYSGTSITNPNIQTLITATGTTALELGNSIVKGISGKQPNSCAAQPAWGTGFTIGNPASPNMPWQNSDSSAACYLSSCLNGHSLPDCLLPDSSTTMLYHFNGTPSGTSTIDSSPSPKTIAFNGNTAISSTGYFLQSIAFDGNSDYARVSDSTDFSINSATDFTIDFYMNARTLGNYSILIKGSPGNGNGSTGHGIWMTNLGKIQFSAGYCSGGTCGNYRAATTSGGITANTWNHIAIVKTGSSLNIYINGIQQSLTQFSGAGNAGLSTYNGISYDNSSCDYIFGGANVICGGGNPASAWFDGYIDEFRISKGIARWTSNFTPPTIAY